MLSSKNELIDFKQELNALEAYWKNSDGQLAASESFLNDIKDIKLSLESAIMKDYSLRIG